MRKEFVEVIKGKTYTITVSCSDSAINKFIPTFNFEDNEEAIGYTIESGALPYTKENLEIQRLRFIDIVSADDFLDTVLSKMDRKANGLLAVGRVYYPYTLPWGTEWEDSYCMAHEALKAKTINETTVEITWDYYKDKW